VKNRLANGTILPSGLLKSQTSDAMLAGFNKTYKNTGLKAGIVISSYPVGDPLNVSGLCTEYDVVVIEQSEKSAMPITYRNCLSTDGMGSIADYFEKSLRPMKVDNNKNGLTFKNQDGAIVLILCLFGMSDKGIIVGSLIHPDRDTTLTSTAPKLSGEYNGVNVLINPDGSCALSFKGSTKNDGTPVNPSLGITEFKIEADGSFQFDHSAVTIRGDKNGQATITTKTSCTINATQAVNINSGADTVVNAKGACNVTSTGKTVVTASEIDLNGMSGMVQTTETDPITDYITGVPTVGSQKVKAGP
jgi:hypothetical protein